MRYVEEFVTEGLPLFVSEPTVVEFGLAGLLVATVIVGVLSIVRGTRGAIRIGLIALVLGIAGHAPAVTRGYRGLTVMGIPDLAAFGSALQRWGASVWVGAAICALAVVLDLFRGRADSPA